MSDFPERIAYVDDDSLMRDFLRDITNTEKPGTVVATCMCGDELLKRLREIQPELIILDVRMSPMTGPDVLDLLRDNPDGADIPVIFYTGEKRLKMIDHYRRLGVLGVLYKTAESDSVISDIGALWGNYAEELLASNQ